MCPSSKAKADIPGIIKELRVDDDHDKPFYKKFGSKRLLAVQGLYYVLNLGLLIQSFSHTKKRDEQDSLHLIDIIASTNTLVSVVHSGTSGLYLTSKAVAMWKGVDVSTFKFANKLDKVGTYLGHKMMILSAITSWIDMKKYAEEGDTSAEVKEWINFSANMAMFIGYAMRKNTTSILLKAGSKAIAKFLVCEAVLGEIALTGIGAIIFAIGTIVSTLMLIWDIGKIAWALLEDWIYGTPEYKMFSIYWESFKEKSDPSRLEGIIKDFSKYKQLPPRLLNSYESRKRIEKVYDFYPYLTYKSEKVQGKGDILIEALEIVDEYALDYGWFDTGVKWNKINWRAIIPLHLLGMKQDDIGKVVEFPEDINFNGYSINSVHDLIKYYKLLRENDHGYDKQEFLDYADNKCKALSEGTVARLLEIGKFTAREGMKLPNGKRYERCKFFHYHFYIPEEYSIYGLDEFPYYLRNEVYVTDVPEKRQEIWRKIFCLSDHDLAMAKAEGDRMKKFDTNTYGYDINSFVNDKYKFKNQYWGYRYRSWASSKGDYIKADKKKKHDALLKSFKEDNSAGNIQFT